MAAIRRCRCWRKNRVSIQALVSTILGGCILGGVVHVTHAADELDQENDPTWGGANVNIQTVNLVGQRFKTTCQNHISAVEVDLLYQGGDGNVTAKLLRNGEEIGSTTQTTISSDGWARLEFYPVRVTSDETLVLRLESDDFPSPLWKYDGDTYDDGERWFYGSARPSYDHYFRTYCFYQRVALNKPGCLNINGHGKIPVTIYGEDDVQVANIKPETLSFGGLQVGVIGRGKPHCSQEDVDGDYLDDLACHFEDDPELWQEGTDTARLKGEKIGGSLHKTSIGGSTEICVVP